MPLYCSPFDEVLAHVGPPAIFRLDRDGNWRLDVEWTRDCWGRTDDTPSQGTVYALVRDIPTGFVQMMLATASDLLENRPGVQVRCFDSYADALTAFNGLGKPPVVEETW